MVGGELAGTIARGATVIATPGLAPGAVPAPGAGGICGTPPIVTFDPSISISPTRSRAMARPEYGPGQVAPSSAAGRRGDT